MDVDEIKGRIEKIGDDGVGGNKRECDNHRHIRVKCTKTG